MEEGKLNLGIEELIERYPFQLNSNSFGKRGISSSPGALKEGGGGLCFIASWTSQAIKCDENWLFISALMIP